MTDPNLLNLGVFPAGQTLGQCFQTGTPYGAQRMAQVDQEGAELTRAGRRFQIGLLSTVTGIAPVAALPTTAAQWTIFNTSLTNTLTFEQLGMHLVSGTAAAGVVVIGAYFSAPAQVANATGVSAVNLSNSAKTSAAIIKSSVTITTPAAPVWFQVAKSDSPNTAVLSVVALNQAVDGQIMLPPQTGLALCTLSGTGTSPLFAPIAQWTEGPQNLE